MKSNSGYSFLELIVVVAIVGVIATFSISSNKQLISANKILSEAEKTAAAVSQAIVQARSSLTTIKLTCSASGIQGNYYRGARSNVLNATLANAQGLSLGVVSATSGAFTSGNLMTYSAPVAFTCPVSCGNLYITSDGSLISSNNCAQFDFIFGATSSPELQAKLTLSNAGYPRIYILDSTAQNLWTEVVK